MLVIFLILAPIHIGLTVSTGKRLEALKEQYREDGRIMVAEDLRTRWTNGIAPVGYDESRARDHTGRCAAEYLTGRPYAIDEPHDLWMGWQDFYKEELHPYTTTGSALFYTCTPEQEAEIRAIVQENKDLLDSLHAVCRLEPSRPEWVYEAMQIEEKGLNYAQIPNLLACRSFANLMTVEAFLAYRDGRSDEALEICGDLVRFSNHIRDIPILINQMIGVALTSIALEFFIHLTEYADFSEEAIEELDALLARSDYRIALDTSYEAERLFIMSIFRQEFFRQDSRFNPSLGRRLLVPTIFRLAAPVVNHDYSTTLSLFNERHAISRMPLWESQSRVNTLQDRTDNLGYLSPFTRMALPNLGRSFLSQIENEVGLAGARTVLALRRYKQAKGRFPDSLAELTPAFLSSPVVDPVSGAPPEYTRRDNGFDLHFAEPDLDGYDLTENVRRIKRYYISFDR